jgi:hypothetical protein
LLAAFSAVTTATAAVAVAVAAILYALPAGVAPPSRNSAFPPPVPTSILSPVLVSVAVLLDLNTLSGAKLFKYSAEPLSQTFDFSDQSDLQVFLDLLKTKSKVQGWSRIFTL